VDFEDVDWKILSPVMRSPSWYSILTATH
jgi:hypothetical protein